MQCYANGKKKRLEEDWIKQENTHAALISKEVFLLVKEKAKSTLKFE